MLLNSDPKIRSRMRSLDIMSSGLYISLWGLPFVDSVIILCHSWLLYSISSSWFQLRQSNTHILIEYLLYIIFYYNYNFNLKPNQYLKTPNKYKVKFQ